VHPRRFAALSDGGGVALKVDGGRAPVPAKPGRLILVFWTFDIILTFCTGYVNTNGTVVMVPKKIAMNYMKSRWFPLDLVVVGPDWVLSLIEVMSGGGGG